MKTSTRNSSKSHFTIKCPRVLPLAAAALSLLTFSAQAAGPLYQSVVTGDGPLAYYRFNDSTNRPAINANTGSLGSTGNATNLHTHAVNESPIVGSLQSSTFFDNSARTIVPWNAALNPNASNDFTVEGWFNPTTDGTFGSYIGPSPIMNRLSGAAANRQGWVFFQRSPDSSYANPDGVGWNFRTYTGAGEDVGVTLTSQAPYHVGEWQYVAVVWSGAAQTATMYINGTNVGSAGNSSSDQLAYVADTDTNGITDPAVNAPNGPAGFSIGAYNNTDPGDDPFFGAVANVAFYSKQLSPAQLLAHYQNATNASRSESYDGLVASDGAVGYWKLDDQSSATNDVAINQGTLESSGQAINTAEVRHPGSVPLASGNSTSYVYHNRDGSATTDLQSWFQANNPASGIPFTLELWARPTWDQIDNGEAPINNRFVEPNGPGNRTGWVIFQRNPSTNYNAEPGASGVGWTFRMYDGTGSSGQDVLTDVPYNVGEWQHLVFTWQPVADQGPASGNGEDFWQGIQTAYVDGVSVATNADAYYCANTNVTSDGSPAADFAVGSYNAASGLGSNPFEGEVADVAFYNNYILTTNQIMDHYSAFTNAHPATNYATLVLTAEYDGLGTQGLQPASFFRLNEPAFLPATNYGTLGDAALGSLVDTTNDVPGPITAGFELANLAVPVGNPGGWAALGNPAGLSNLDQLTLEAWILPSATQDDGTNRIISYGPPTPTDSLQNGYNGTPYPVPLTGIELSSNELFLAITNGGADYVFNYYDGTNYHGVSYPVNSDLSSGQWVYLAGTYDGTTWRLFRNGEDVTNTVDAVTNISVPGSEWGIGSTGQGWADYFNGSIDEVAIYNKALSPATIGAHYLVAQTNAVTLTITSTSTNVTVNWPAGSLQSSSSLSGIWTDLPSATAPYKAPIGPGDLFYRVKL